MYARNSLCRLLLLPSLTSCTPHSPFAACPIPHPFPLPLASVSVRLRSAFGASAKVCATVCAYELLWCGVYVCVSVRVFVFVCDT